MATKAMKRTTGSKAKRSSAMKTKANVAMTSMHAMKRKSGSASEAMEATNALAIAKTTKRAMKRTTGNDALKFTRNRDPLTNAYATWIRPPVKDVPEAWLQVLHNEKKLLGYKEFAKQSAPVNSRS